MIFAETDFYTESLQISQRFFILMELLYRCARLFARLFLDTYPRKTILRINEVNL